MCVVVLSTGVAVTIARDHFHKDVTADSVIACLPHSVSSPLRVTCFFKSGRTMPLALGLAHPVLALNTSSLPHTIDIVVDCGEIIAIIGSSRVYMYKREDLLESVDKSSASSNTSSGTGEYEHKSADFLNRAACCTQLLQAPSLACALTGHGGMLAVSCATTLVVVMLRDYRVMSTQFGACHSMVAAGPSSLITSGNDGVLRITRVCVQQQHVLLHVIWAGDRCYDKPLFGALQASMAVPSAACVFLPDASILRFSVCSACDVVCVSAVAAAPKRDHVVIAAATST